MSSIKISKDTFIELSKLNRHGFITGSTGSGKTITLKVIAEQLSENGIPVILSDIKGDLGSMIEEGVINEAISKRIEDLDYSEYENRNFPVEFFDVFCEKGIPLRTTISEMGPLLLSKLLGLNETQEGILNIAFKLADDEKLLLIDVKDLRSMLNFIDENKKELSKTYGNISSTSIGAILRSILVLEQQGGNLFFGEPDFEILDFLKLNENREGIINILYSTKLYERPQLYATFLLWILSELYENLPEAGDVDKPKVVFFFDEAHVLFENSNSVVIEKIEHIVRLIRSKGVGVFFVTQKATDIPDEILAQLGNRIQHSLRAYTPKEQKEVKAVADSFRQDGDLDLVEEILNLKTGEAVVSTLDEDSKPTFARKVMIVPPKSKIGTVDEYLVQSNINKSQLLEKYGESIDNESAYEILKRREEEAVQLEKIEAEKIEIEKIKEKEEKKKSNKTSFLERFANNVIGSVGRSVGREITRGIFGSRKR